MKKYKHFVIIRFNIKANFSCKIRNPNDNPMKLILNKNYLEQRFNLFEVYTLPSLKNQTCQNFETIVLFHNNTPQKFKDKIKDLKKYYQFESVFLKDEEMFSFEKYVEKKYSGGGYRYYITSRLDNDDMYGKRYIEKIQDYVNRQEKLEPCIFSFIRGEKFDLLTKSKYEYDYKQNHFLSLLSPSQKNIFMFDHSLIEKTNYKIIILEKNTAMWTEIVHASNVANTINSYEKYQHALLQLNYLDIKTPYIAIYGLGEIGKAVYSKFKNLHKIICFIDEYSSVKNYEGIQVLRINELSRLKETYTIVIAVSYDCKIIEKNLREQLGNEVQIKDIYEMYEAKNKNYNNKDLNK